MVKNVILLTMDALGARHFGRLGYERDTAPRLNEIASEAMWYTSCFAQSSHTRESMPSLFASAYPTQLDDIGFLPSSRPTLPEVLSDAGFATAGFHSNPYLSRAYGFDRGFDDFDDSLPLASNRISTYVHRVINHFKRQPYRVAESLNDLGLDWLDDTVGERRFLWLHYMDPHGPYQPPPMFQQAFRDDLIGTRQAKKLWRRTIDEPETITEQEREILIDLYDAEIRYTDAMVGQLVDELRIRDMLSESLVVIGADHGDAFGEHGFYGHPRHLYEELIHVPLLIHAPNGGNEIVDRPVENVDIAPTILDAVGLSSPPEFEGRSLLSSLNTQAGLSGTPVARGRGENTTHGVIDTTLTDAAVAEAHGEGDERDIVRTAIRTYTKKLHVTTSMESGEIVETELYDLSFDPNEETAIDDTDTHERLLQFYRHHRGRVGGTSARDCSGNDEVNAAVEDRLHDLGYR